MYFQSTKLQQQQMQLGSNKSLLTKMGLNDSFPHSKTAQTISSAAKSLARPPLQEKPNNVSSYRRLQVLRSILAVVTGTGSSLFPWQANSGRFRVALPNDFPEMNARTFQASLEKYAILGTQFRAMFDFACDPEKEEYYASRGRIFGAFRVALRVTLQELIGQTMELLERRYAYKQRMTASEAEGIEANISLLEVEFLFEDSSSLFLTIRHLHAIFLKVLEKQSFEWPRLYAHQTLLAVCERLFIPQRRLRSALFTLLDHCLGPFFSSLGYLLTSWSSIAELSSTSASECLLTSSFESDEELLVLSSYDHTELRRFWEDLLHLDKNTFFGDESKGRVGNNLFSGEGFQALIEAIKACFVFRLNGLQINEELQAQLNKAVAPGAIGATFRWHLNDCFRRYALSTEDLQKQILNLQSPYEVEVITQDCPEDPLLSKNPLFRQVRLERFTGYQLPLVTSISFEAMLEEAFTATYQAIARPITSAFLEEIRQRHLRLLRYYTDFFLLQKTEHLLHYIHFLFPMIRDTIEEPMQLDAFGLQLEAIHRRLENSGSSMPDFAPVVAFFKTSFSPAIAERTIQENSSASPHTAHLQLFSSLFFVPSFGNTISKKEDLQEKPFYNFWPLPQLFNSKVNELFNRLLQFLLKLRFSHHQLSIEVLQSMRAAGKLQSSNSSLSSSSSSLLNITEVQQTNFHQLTRAHYLTRHRLVTAVGNIGLSLECRLKAVVQLVEARLEAATSFDALLAAHQDFLQTVEQLAKVGEKEGGFFATTIASTAKFCYRTRGGRGGEAEKRRLNRRRLSFYRNISSVDGRVMNQDEYFDSVIL